MKKGITSIFMLLCFGFVFSQNNTIESNPGGTIVVALLGNNNTPREAEGSPYIKEDFSSTQVNDYDVIYLVRYNAFNDLMEFKDKDSKIFLLDKSKDYIIKFNDGSNKVYHTVNFEDNTRGYAKFLWANSDNNLTLYSKERVKFTEEKKAKSGYEEDIPAKYIRLKDFYYIKTSDGPLRQLSTKKKNFFTAFKDKGKEVQQYVKKGKLKINKKEDIIKIISFYDSLN
ncbi:hypothetical protein GTQ40_09375 [Flavobacteriaceae bacterium R38]|nr:hypothetical protein [Flavobacteriaceae bacterium R38]